MAKKKSNQATAEADGGTSQSGAVFLVLSKLHHDGDVYEAGEEIEGLTEKQAEPLLKFQVIKPLEKPVQE